MDRRPSLPRRAPRSRTRFVAAALSVALSGGALAACVPEEPAPPGPPGSELPGDINLMTDEQAAYALELMSDEAVKGLETDEVQKDVPPEYREQVARFIRLLKTPEGRKILVPELRESGKGVVRGLPQRAETVDLRDLELSAGDFSQPPTGFNVTGTRVPPPTGPGATSGASIDVGQPTTTACRAPNGGGTLAAPTDVVAGQLLAPQHDVFTSIGAGGLVPAGVDPIANGGPGIQLRTGPRGTPQMLVRVNMEDPKKFGPAALYPLINIKPIGGTPADERRATVTDGRIYCYAGDTRTDRGYFEGWVDVPAAEPGFQVIAEVVDNDWYFNNVQYDFLLGAIGPQYFAGADRATIHTGAAPLVNTQALPASVGAFATSAKDPGTGVANVLTDTNGVPTDDVEGAITAYLANTIRTKVNGVLAGDLLQIYVATVQAWLTAPLDTNIDVRFTTPQDGFPGAGELNGPSGALRVDATVKAKIDTFVQVAGIPCTSISANVTADLHANVWANSTGNDTGINPRMEYSESSDIDMNMPKLAWLNPTCVIARGLDAVGLGEYFIDDGVTGGLTDTFFTTPTVACLLNPAIYHPDGTLVDPAAGIPEQCKKIGTVQKLLQNLDLNNYLPTVSLGSANIHPVIADLDNSWCHAGGAPAGCNGDQDLIGKDGVGIVADTALVASLGQALGGGLGGRFRNVFSPTTTSSVADLTTGHRDAAQQFAGLGIVVDPRLVNLTLRHLMQGSSTTRTTNGLLDVGPLALPIAGWSITTRPEVAPMILGTTKPQPYCTGNCVPVSPNPPAQGSSTVVAPDLRASLTTGPGAPIRFSISTTVDAGATFDASTKKLKPTLQSPNVDFQVTGGCQADYTSAYALSYTMCGRGTGGNGGQTTNGNPISLTSVIGFVVDNVVIPVLNDSIGSIALPSLDGIVPGLHVSLDKVRYQQRGGFVSVYADLRPTPRIGIAPSTEQIGGVTYLRFFPQLWNIDVSTPTTYTWSVKDAATGQVVATTFYPGTSNSAVMAPVTSFQDSPTNFGPGKKALVTLTVRQGANLEVTATGETVWYPPAPPPNNPCIPGVRAGGPSLQANVTPVTANAAPGC